MNMGDLAALALFWLGLLAPSLQGKVDPRQWTFAVTPQGNPYGDILLMRSEEPTAFPRLSLRPVVVFDGGACLSKVEVPELETWLIKNGGDQYEWRRLTGGTITFRKDLFNAWGSSWRVSRGSEGTTLLTTLAKVDLSESYEYQGCFLRSFIRGEYRFMPIYDGNRLLRIEEATPFSQTVLQIEYSADGQRKTIRSGAYAADLFFNEHGQLLRCVDEQTRSTIVEYHYGSDRLLHEVAQPNKTMKYEWRVPSWSEPYNTYLFLNPVVSSDGYFNYTTHAGPEITSVDFESRDGRISGMWKYNSLRSELSCDFKKGDFKTVAAYYEKTHD